MAKPFRSEGYRRYVASKDCFCCGISGFSQCAHANGGGMGTKTSDLETFPLCCARPGKKGCHEMFDQCDGIDKLDRRNLTFQYIARMQHLAKSEGRKEFK